MTTRALSGDRSALRQILDAIHEVNREAKPALKSVTMHPDDYDAVKNHPAVVATTPDGHSDWMFPMSILGVPIHKNSAVPRGAPWYDPPEAAPTPKRSGAR